MRSAAEVPKPGGSVLAVRSRPLVAVGAWQPTQNASRSRAKDAWESASLKDR